MRRSYSVNSKKTATGALPGHSVVEAGGRKAPFLYLVCTKSKNKAPQCKTVGLFGFKDGRFVDVVSLFPLAYSKLEYVLKRQKERVYQRPNRSRFLGLNAWAMTTAIATTR